MFGIYRRVTRRYGDFFMENIPNDPFLLLSFLNMKLRDFYPSLADLCEDLGLNEQELFQKMQEIGYSYDKMRNQFV